jgi:hypothetical protein
MTITAGGSAALVVVPGDSKPVSVQVLKGAAITIGTGDPPVPLQPAAFWSAQLSLPFQPLRFCGEVKAGRDPTPHRRPLHLSARPQIRRALVSGTPIPVSRMISFPCHLGHAPRFHRSGFPPRDFSGPCRQAACLARLQAGRTSRNNPSCARCRSWPR